MSPFVTPFIPPTTAPGSHRIPADVPHHADAAEDGRQQIRDLLRVRLGQRLAGVLQAQQELEVVPGGHGLPNKGMNADGRQQGSGCKLEGLLAASSNLIFCSIAAFLIPECGGLEGVCVPRP
jgi:hypothetical protein